MSWASIRGHGSAHQQLLASFSCDRLAHAYLFVGPQGIGKKLFAIEFAKALLCDRPLAPLTACDQCASCIQVKAGTHPDFLTAERPEDKQELPIDVIRLLCDQFGTKAVRGQRKVAIVDDADDLNEEAANCFLKTLEEPPVGSTLVLLASTSEGQLPTIQSRCQVIRFRALNDQEMQELLSQSLEISSDRLQQVIRLANGSPGQAHLLAQEPVWLLREALLQCLAQAKPRNTELTAILIRFVESAGKEAPAQRAQAAIAVRLLLDIWQNCLHSKLNLESDGNDESMYDFAKSYSEDQIADILDACVDASYQLDRRVQVVLVIELLAQLCTKSMSLVAR